MVRRLTVMMLVMVLGGCTVAAVTPGDIDGVWAFDSFSREGTSCRSRSG